MKNKNNHAAMVCNGRYYPLKCSCYSPTIVPEEGTNINETTIQNYNSLEKATEDGWDIFMNTSEEVIAVCPECNRIIKQ